MNCLRIIVKEALSSDLMMRAGSKAFDKAISSVTKLHKTKPGAHLDINLVDDIYKKSIQGRRMMAAGLRKSTKNIKKMF